MTNKTAGCLVPEVKGATLCSARDCVGPKVSEE